MLRHSFPYALARSLKNFRSDGFARGWTVFILAACLFWIGVSATAYRTTQRLLPTWIPVTRTVIWLAPGTTPGQCEESAEELRKRTDIESVRIVTAKEARERLAARLGDAAEVLDDAGEESLLPSLDIVFRPAAVQTPEKREILHRELARIPHAADIPATGERVERLRVVLDSSATVMFFIVALVLPFALAATTGAVRLSILKSSGEIRLYEVAGATPAFIRLPFYLEGGLCGLAAAIPAGAVPALLFLFAGRDFPGRLSPVLSAFHTWEAAGIFAGLIPVGLLLGLSGAWIATQLSLHLTVMEFDP